MERLARSFPDCDKGDQQQAIECALDKTYARRATRDTLEQTARADACPGDRLRAREGFRDDALGTGKDRARCRCSTRATRSPMTARRVRSRRASRTSTRSRRSRPNGPTQQATNFLTEYNLYMIHDLSIHEAMPGHYLQLDHANMVHDPLRARAPIGALYRGMGGIRRGGDGRAGLSRRRRDRGRQAVQPDDAEDAPPRR